MPAKDKWAVSTSEEEVTSSRYAPVVETHRKKKKNKEPPIINNRFPGGGFAARMKKRELRRKDERHHGSKVVSYKMQLRVSTSTSSNKCASRKKDGAREGSIMKKASQFNTRPKVQSSKSGESSLKVNKEEEVEIEDFDSQELLQEAPVRAWGDAGAINRPTNSRKVGSPKENNKREGEMSSSKVEGPLPRAGSSKTAVINSQPQFAPSQLDGEDWKVLEGKPKDSKQGILKKVVCSSKPVQESISPINAKRKYDTVEEELITSSVSKGDRDDGFEVSSDFREGKDQEDAGRGFKSALADGEGEVQEQEKGLKGNTLAGVFSEDNKESAEEDENTVPEDDETDALADLFSDYEVEEAQDNSEQGLVTDAEAGIFSGA